MKWNRIKTDDGIEYISDDGRFTISKDGYGTARWALTDNKNGSVNECYTKKEAESTAYFLSNHEFISGKGYVETNAERLQEPRTQIKELREACKMTQREFAQYFEIPQRTIENWESGTTTPPAYLVSLIEYKSAKSN